MLSTRKGFGTTTLVTADLELQFGAGAGENKLILLTMPMRQEVYVTDDNLPIVGTRAERLGQTEHDIDGFNYDRRQWESDEASELRQTSRIGEVLNGAIDGTLLTHWKSGIGHGDDCKFLELYDKTPWTWLPRLHHGDYYSHYFNYFLWSEQSLVLNYLEVGDIFDVFQATPEDVITFPLEYSRKIDTPIFATIFRRTGMLEGEVFLRADLVSHFTGDVSGHALLETEIIPGEIDLSKVETFHNYELMYRLDEFDSPELLMNQEMSHHVGIRNLLTLNNNGSWPSVDPVALAASDYAQEQMGTGDGLTNAGFFTRFFPIYPSAYATPSIVVTVRDGVTVDRWLEATNNSLHHHTDTDKVYEIDHDYGIVRFAKLSADSVGYLSVALGSGDTIVVLDDASSFTNSGRIQVGAETIVYDHKEGDTLYSLTRSAPAAHLLGAEVTPLQCGLEIAAGEQVAISYIAVPRIEYEPENWVDYVTADTENTHPLSNPVSNGIAYITRRPLEIDSLVLSIDQLSLGGGTYGPLPIGSEYAVLTATALDIGGAPISGLGITIEEPYENPFIGFLNGVPAPYFSLSNQDGETIASFTVGSDFTLVGDYATTHSLSGGKTTLTIPREIQGLSLDEIFLFAVTKDDPMLGTEGVWVDPVFYFPTGIYPNTFGRVEMGNVIVDGLDPLSVSNLPLNSRYPDGYFDGGKIWVTDSTPTIHYAEIVYYRDGIAHLDRNILVAGAAELVRIKAASWEDWDATPPNGRKKVIYEYDATATNPVTADDGAYFPVQPESVSVGAGVTTVVFPFELPGPSLSDEANNLGAYWLTVDRVIAFQAYADSPLTGRRVLSNIIQLKVSLPDYLKGVVLVGSSQVPYGFQIASSAATPSSGLEGSTFVTINPISGTYLAMQNPFASMSFLLNTP